MAHFLIEFPHTKDECMGAKDQVNELAPDLMPMMDWGCLEDQHSGWGIVEADSMTEVRSMLPPDLHERASITLINEADVGRIRELKGKAA